MPRLLQSSGLTFAYGDRTVLRDIGLSLETGEVVALFGPNGSGKSTLIRVLLGQLRAGGEVSWLGRPLPDWRRRELARAIAYLPQAPTHEPGQTVGDILRLGRLPYWGAFGIESGRDEQVVRAVAEKLDLADLLDRRITEVSGGQKQRVFIGRCLAQEPKALLLDEPTTFLDLRYQIDLLRLLRSLARERGIGIIMASHDLNLTSLHADRAVILHEGAAVADGPPRDVLTADLLQRVYGVAMRRVETDGAVHLVPET